jgi:hypothetical protein
MRLLNARTIELVQFLPGQIPPYAILSHTWSIDPDEEVLFPDVGKEEAKQKRAYQQKVLPTCRKALELGFGYVWIDTCCIDKTSSAELQEAINSMFKWYSDSSICFAYLEDVSPNSDESDSDIEYALFSSRWFTRGWTLQELIAPGEIVFYSKFWDSLGTRASLANLISQKTKIDERILTKTSAWDLQIEISRRSVANRMSWAAFRETTRPEDIAYCLLGIFDVNMPMIYGEGKEKAFFRLQEAILETSDDQSLLAWTASSPSPFNLRGPLAEHPIEFRDAGRIVPLPGVPDMYSLTSSGLRIDLLVSPDIDPFSYYDGSVPSQLGVWGVLRCHYKNDFTGPLAIPLVPQPWLGNRVYARRCAALTTIDRSSLANRDIFQNGPFLKEHQAQSQFPTIIIQRNPKPWKPSSTDFHLENWPIDCTLIKAIPEEKWNARSQIMITDNYDVTRAFIFEHVISTTRFAVVLGFSFRYPGNALGIVKVFELDPGMRKVPFWLRGWESKTSINMNWSKEDLKSESALVSSFRKEGSLRGIRATLRKGQIMGVPFFIANFKVLTDSDGCV